MLYSGEFRIVRREASVLEIDMHFVIEYSRILPARDLLTTMMPCKFNDDISNGSSYFDSLTSDYCIVRAIY